MKNGVVGPIHPKAMPVRPTTLEEWSTWLAAPTEVALGGVNSRGSLDDLKVILGWVLEASHGCIGSFGLE
jgi:hypothetical protein